jgi:LCP family protein required for cell wall assembly
MPPRPKHVAGRPDAAEGVFGPVLRGRPARRRRPWARVAVVSLVALALLAATAGATVVSVLWYGTQQVGRVEVDHLRQAGDVDGDGTIDVEELTEVLTVMVVGTDSREGLSDEQLELLGTEREDGSRTDTIMLAQLDPDRDQVAVLSFPRDLLVDRCDGSRGKINAAYGIGERTGIGGPTCLVQTVTEFTGIPVNHFVQVDFAGFIDIVDAIGGVTLYLDEPLVDAYAGLDLPAGCVELDGRSALGFVRTRRIDSDFGRIARQQRFLREVVAEAVSVGTLVNVPRVLSLVDAVGRSIDADQDLTGAHMRRIAFSLRRLDVDALDMRTVPGESRRIDGVWYVVPDTDASAALFAAFRESREAPEDLGTREVVEVDVADVPPLTVLNGAGVGGLGTMAAERLREGGFTVETVGNAERYDHERTLVRYPPDLQGHAGVVAAALGGAELVPASGGELTVVLGTDYEVSVQDAGAPPAPTAAPAPTPSFQAADPTEHHC